ncbi:MAG: hypothetical protein M5U26_05140 [Planctomycetota bacterium]|nr:hypothetical protein [Planctomycetota bacterium]
MPAAAQVVEDAARIDDDLARGDLRDRAAQVFVGHREIRVGQFPLGQDAQRALAQREFLVQHDAVQGNVLLGALGQAAAVHVRPVTLAVQLDPALNGRFAAPGFREHSRHLEVAVGIDLLFQVLADGFGQALGLVSRNGVLQGPPRGCFDQAGHDFTPARRQLEPFASQLGARFVVGFQVLFNPTFELNQDDLVARLLALGRFVGEGRLVLKRH